jgi:hypothetical protein
MSKLGFKFYQAIDSMLIAIALQFRNLGLKELVLEYGLAKYTEVVTFRRLMSKLGYPEDHNDFSVIDLVVSPEAFDYAVHDPIFSYELGKVLYGQYENLIGSGFAGLNIQAQVNTMLLLCESSAKGSYINKEYLNDFIKQYGGELKKFEDSLMAQVRKEMGWDQIVDKSVSDGIR